LQWFEYSMLFTARLCEPMGLTFANVATHNHFALQRAAWLNNAHAPVIKLPPRSTEEDYLVLLGLLNSSTACFWMRQVFQPKGGCGIGRGIQPESWMERYEFDARKMQAFPVAARSADVVPYAARLDSLARTRSARTVRGVLDARLWRTAAELRSVLDQRRTSDVADLAIMVALQEELDWLVYVL